MQWLVLDPNSVLAMIMKTHGWESFHGVTRRVSLAIEHVLKWDREFLYADQMLASYIIKAIHPYCHAIKPFNIGRKGELKVNDYIMCHGSLEDVGLVWADCV